MTDPSHSSTNEPPGSALAGAAQEGRSEDLSYEMGVARVEEIVRRLDAGEASLGETLQLVREGKELIEHCAHELEAVGGALEELRLEDLVARLEDSSGAGAAGGGST